jgi:hypothetical protein
MNINIAFTGGSKPEISRFILSELGFPFRRPEPAATTSKKPEAPKPAPAAAGAEKK